jgi:GT2 family glycosyltransferase
MRIVVVIPMFGKEEYTNKCVEKVKENYGTGEPIEILVVDDGSPTPYVNPTINVIRLDKNSGFTAATNAGILWAQHRNVDYVLLLNNDTEPEPRFLKYLVDALENDHSLGIAASIRRHPNREPQSMELCGSDLIRGYQYFTDEKSLDGKDIPIPCNWVPLCSGLLRMDMIREIGMLDKRFRNHCSDSSYCLWAKINHWGVVIVPKSIVVHHLSITTTENKVMVDDDQKLFLEKISGIDYANIMSAMPLDGEAGTYGRLLFEVYKK